MKIEFENVYFEYQSSLFGNHSALQELSFQLDQGEMVGIVGPAGSGKTTLVQLINGLYSPTQGQILWNGNSFSPKKKKRIAEVQKKVGLVFQFPESQLFEDTVFQDIAFGPKNSTLSPAEIELKVKKAMKWVGLEYNTFRECSPFHLSGGEMRRVAIAGILAMEPEVLILDEPTVGLDWEGTQKIEAILETYCQQGKSVIFISHDMDLVSRLTNRVILLVKGQLHFDGDKTDLFKNKDLMDKAGLQLPQLTQYLISLQEKGCSVPLEYYKVDEVKKYLTK